MHLSISYQPAHELRGKHPRTPTQKEKKIPSFPAAKVQLLHGDDDHHHFPTICATRWRHVRPSSYINTSCSSSGFSSLHSQPFPQFQNLDLIKSCVERTFLFHQNGSNNGVWELHAMVSTFQILCSSVVCSPHCDLQLIPKAEVLLSMVLSLRNKIWKMPCLLSAVTKITQSKKIMVARTKLIVRTWVPLSPQEAIPHGGLVSV